ncbi:uncharacterized protein LOC131023294 [Salvia miltiorrhiza]|uniref:uncharacterized protein LOC131023294 n=1 Tax=Salvia miltiorrhiza TaxID=226208 RepID=UPI0025ACA198|nr:uncharacterized protein LOC131023294 [Salvia miltiorrhiza]
MAIAMANFLTSLGSMDDKSLLMNVVALGILVITIIGNVCIQIIQMRSYLHARHGFWEESIAMASMLVLLLMFVSSALTILSTKQYLESRYRDIHKSALKEEQLLDMRRASTRKLRALIKKYWVMAETSSPQFVIARSVTSAVSGIVSLIMAVVLVEAGIRIAMETGLSDQPYSSYKKSSRGVLLSQTVGVMVGAVAPASRWFVSINHRTSAGWRNNVENAFAVEGYWTQKLVEWQHSSLSIGIQHLKSRKLSKKIVSQTLPIKACLDYIRRLRHKKICDSDSGSSNSQVVEIRRYAIQLQGEVELPAETLRNMFKEMDEIIKKGKTRKSKNLLNLLSKSCNFKGVMEFDSHQVPSLHPHCWSLPVVTLACIARAIPNVEKDKSERLLGGVIEGLRYVKLIDKLVDRKGQLAKARAAANTVSEEAELNGKWQKKDLDQISVKGKNAEDILQQLHEDSERTVLEFKGDCGQLNVQDIVAASACLTNLAHAIIIKCHRSAIEERERGVRRAAKYLGETEEIIALLQQRQLPILDPQRAACIQEWRALLSLEDQNNPHEIEDQIIIDVEDHNCG